jgi:hypothetical protein
LPDQPDIRYSRSVDLYAGVNLVEDIQREVLAQRIRIRVGTHRKAGPLLERLYDPDSYDGLIAAAWQRFMDGSISVRRVYPSDVAGITVERTFRLRHSDFGTSRDDVAGLAL